MVTLLRRTVRPARQQSAGTGAPRPWDPQLRLDSGVGAILPLTGAQHPLASAASSHYKPRAGESALEDLPSGPQHLSRAGTEDTACCVRGTDPGDATPLTPTGAATRNHVGVRTCSL